jgi:hypothetical protein
MKPAVIRGWFLIVALGGAIALFSCSSGTSNGDAGGSSGSDGGGTAGTGGSGTAGTMGTGGSGTGGTAQCPPGKGCMGVVGCCGDTQQCCQTTTGTFQCVNIPPGNTC